MNMIQDLQRKLKDVGVSISFTPAAYRTLRSGKRKTSGWVVELAGPSGIGKTHLCRQFAAELAEDWHFERHARGLIGHVVEDKASADYLLKLFTLRAERLRNTGLSVTKQAQILKRMAEVLGLSIVSKAPELPRGFILDDGMVHFFAQQIVAGRVPDARYYFQKTAVIFLVPSRQELVTPRDDHESEFFETATGRKIPWRGVDVYYEAQGFLEQLDVPVLTLHTSAADRQCNKGAAIDFIKSLPLA